MSEIPEELRVKVMKWRDFPRQRPEHIEQTGPGKESVWDYPRPPRVETVDAEIRVEFSDQIIAATTRALRVLETSSPPVYYIPPQDVRRDLLVRARQTALCE